jgi:hypothetical protein
VIAIALTLPVACDRPNAEPRCRAVPATVLMAESVPSARLVPCVANLPDGWAVQAFSARDGEGTFSLVHEDGARLQADLRATCIPAEEPIDDRAQRDDVEQRMSTVGAGEVRWTSTFTGGCVVESLTVPDGRSAEKILTIHRSIGLLPRTELARALE